MRNGNTHNVTINHVFSHVNHVNEYTIPNVALFIIKKTNTEDSFVPAQMWHIELPPILPQMRQ